MSLKWVEKKNTTIIPNVSRKESVKKRWKQAFATQNYKDLKKKKKHCFRFVNFYTVCLPLVYLYLKLQKVGIIIINSNRFLKDIEKKTHNLRVNLNTCVVVFEQKAEKQNILSKARKYFVQSHTFIYF